MTTWRYRGFRASDGRRVSGRIDAESLKQARERLTAQQILPERLEPFQLASGAGRRWRRGAERAGAYRELSALLSAGLPMIPALEVLIESAEWTEIAPALAGVRDRIREGASPADAFDASGITALESSLLRAGQRAGEIAVVLLKLADLLDEETSIKERVRSAMLYPAIVSTVALLIAIGVFTFLLPAFAQMFVESRVSLPPLTRLVMSMGRVASTAFAPTALAVAGFAWLTQRRLRRSPRLHAAAEQWISRLPLIGSAQEALVGLRFARTLALLLRGGIPMIEALELASTACGSVRVALAMPAEAERIRHGGCLHDAIRNIVPLRRLLGAWVEAGEQCGDLPAMLEIAATRCEQVWNRRLTRGLALVEPTLILVLGALVFLLALAILQPILALHRQIT